MSTCEISDARASPNRPRFRPEVDRTLLDPRPAGSRTREKPGENTGRYRRTSPRWCWVYVIRHTMRRADRLSGSSSIKVGAGMRISNEHVQVQAQSSLHVHIPDILVPTLWSNWCRPGQPAARRRGWRSHARTRRPNRRASSTGAGRKSAGGRAGATSRPPGGLRRIDGGHRPSRGQW